MSIDRYRSVAKSTVRHQTKVTPLVGLTEEFDTRGGYLLTIFPLVSSSYKSRLDPVLENKYSPLSFEYPLEYSNAIFKIFRKSSGEAALDLFVRSFSNPCSISIDRRFEKSSYNPANPRSPKRLDKVEIIKQPARFSI